MPSQETRISLISPPKAPAFILSAPPIEPGMPRRKEKPESEACAAALASLTSATAAPTVTQSSSIESVVESIAKCDDDAFDAAIAHQKIGAEAQRQDGNRGIEPAQKISEVFGIGRRENRLRGAAAS